MKGIHIGISKLSQGLTSYGIWFTKKLISYFVCLHVKWILLMDTNDNDKVKS